MSGNVTAGKKAAQTNKARDPDFYKKIGAEGGRNGHTGGFFDRELARRAGAIGGAKSRRGPSRKTKRRNLLASIRERIAYGRVHD